MKPHIQIHTDKPEELLSTLELFKFSPLPTTWAELLQRDIQGVHFRLVETEHQGFSSYESFSIAILIDSDKKQLSLWLKIAERCLKAPSIVKAPHPQEAAELYLAELLKDHFDTESPEIPSPWNELCNAGLSRVDWLDLARHYITKVKEGANV